MVDNTQRVQFRQIKDDPLKMWGALKEVHLQKRPGTHFNAYDNLFSIRKREEELQSLINRVSDTAFAVHYIHPGHAGRRTRHNGADSSSP